MLIEMNDVSLIQNQKSIIQHMNWKVEDGQHWAILGLNGAGKTTLLNLVCGYLFPTKGSMNVLGKQFGKYPLNDLRKEIGWVSTSLLEKMKYHEDSTGLQIVLSGKFATIGLYDTPTDADVEKATKIMDQTGIQKLRNQSYLDMSQGEKQRILIARAFMASPKMLILDEPCAGLDFLSKEQLLKTIEQMAAQNRTTLIYVTHHVDEILPVFSHTMLLKEGSVFSAGRTENQLTSERMSQFSGSSVHISEKNNRYMLNIPENAI
ncbi:ABC transporter ATP-binding protein [Virgibacillus ihumii]|uniref:ABC transporter ATP-binding protein n=1 Tax=Virgibacillus ihumii TaxID=2686091 RepID=UPI00157DC19D|nr:ABC transporter ATP-binding protein [Virgibacillus ihumii]